MNDNRRTRAWWLVALAASSIPSIAIACGGNKTDPSTPTNGSLAANPACPAGYVPATPPSVGCVAASSTTMQTNSGPQPSASASTAPLAPIDANSLAAVVAGIASAVGCTLLPPGGGGAPNDATQDGLNRLAAKVAPGMQPEGNELKQTLNEGQHAVMMVTMQAGKCYTVAGFSAPGAVKDVDLNLLTVPFQTLAGQDLTHSSEPTIGASPTPMCPVIAMPLQYKLDVFARSGSGQVAVQLYSKAK